MRRAVLVALCAPLISCSSWLKSNAPPLQSYLLHAAPAAPAATGEAPAPALSGASLRVLYPTAAPGFDTDRILLLEPDRRLDYYAASRWAAALPDVVEQLAAESLRRSGHWGNVEDSRGAFPTAYLLQLRIRRFEADYAGEAGAPMVRVAFDCWVGRSDARALLASFSVERTEPAAENRVRAVVAAFERAADEALGEVAERTAAAVKPSG